MADPRARVETHIWLLLRRHRATIPHVDQFVTDLLELFDTFGPDTPEVTARRREVLKGSHTSDDHYHNGGNHADS